MKLERITVWLDHEFREASMEMALDHALLEHTISEGLAAARFYKWNEAATTVGYFHRSSEEADPEHGAIRRYTGGGLVEHGNDVTFALTFPAGSEAASATSEIRYQWIHSNLADSLASCGFNVTLHQKAFQNGERPCFQHAVSRDLIDPETGKKICGGAQRRSRGSVIHQGSIRLPESLRDLNSPWISAFLSSLAGSREPLGEDEMRALTDRSKTLQSDRYANESWNKRS